MTWVVLSDFLHSFRKRLPHAPSSKFGGEWSTSTHKVTSKRFTVSIQIGSVEIQHKPNYSLLWLKTSESEVERAMLKHTVQSCGWVNSGMFRSTCEGKNITPLKWLSFLRLVIALRSFGLKSNGSGNDTLCPSSLVLSYWRSWAM